METVVMDEMNRVIVDLGDRTYSVVVGNGARSQTASLLPATARRVSIVTQSGIPRHLIPEFPDHVVTIHEIGIGEEFKSLSTILELCSAFAQAGMTRNDVVVGVGGGMVTDIAGFAAASYHRGIPVVHVATSLLAMIDAAVGGKTGVNIPEGKNLVGAYWQPYGVVCDLDALDTLPAREMRCGLGEMAKYHFIAREDLDQLPFPQRIARSVEIKAEIVSADEREGGVRALLNYGHTLAHAIEIETDFAMAHGEAVALGLLFAAHLAEAMGRIDADRVSEHYRVVHDVYGIELSLPQGLDNGRLIAAMGRDKKALESITFVLDSANGLEVVPGVSEADIRIALTAFTRRLS